MFFERFPLLLLTVVPFPNQPMGTTSNTVCLLCYKVLWLLFSYFTKDMLSPFLTSHKLENWFPDTLPMAMYWQEYLHLRPPPVNVQSVNLFK